MSSSIVSRKTGENIALIVSYCDNRETLEYRSILSYTISFHFFKKSLLCYHSNLYCWQSIFLSQAGSSRPNPFPPYLGVRCSHACMVHSSAPNRKDWLLAVCAKFLKFNCQSQLLKCIFIHLNRKLIRVSSHDVMAATVP